MMTVMTRTHDRRTGLDIIDRRTCLELVATQHVGRLAIVDGSQPLVFPVNFLLDGDDVVFRTAVGTKLHAAGRSAACFEVDYFEPASRTGWSVMITGRLEEVTRSDARLFARVTALSIEPWATGEHDHWMRVASRSVTGRQIQPSVSTTTR
jgi:uncharacterized protein